MPIPIPEPGARYAAARRNDRPPEAVVVGRGLVRGGDTVADEDRGSRKRAEEHLRRDAAPVGGVTERAFHGGLSRQYTADRAVGRVPTRGAPRAGDTGHARWRETDRA
jgi:hypothetical protein